MERGIRLNRQEDSDKICQPSTTDFARGMKISNAKIFSCSLQSLDFIAKYSSQIISDIVALISYRNLLWTRRQDLAIGFVHKTWVRNSPLVRGGLGSLVVLLLQEVPGNIQGHQSEIFMTRK